MALWYDSSEGVAVPMTTRTAAGCRCPFLAVSTAAAEADDEGTSVAEEGAEGTERIRCMTRATLRA